MGLLSNSVERGSLKPGDHIYSWRNAYIYAHHGIYVGDDRVIHFTGQEVGSGSVLDVFAGSSAPKQVPCATCAPSEGGHGVLSSCLDCFLAGGTLYRYEYEVSPAFFVAKVRGGTCTCTPSDPDEDVVNRAKDLLDIGFGRYNVVTNNCEDFAIYCKTGLLVLDNSTMGQSGQAQGASILGDRVGRLAIVLTSPLRRAATNVCGRAVTAIGKYGVSSGRMATVFGRASTAIGKFGVISGSMAYGGAAVVIVEFGVYSYRRYATDIGVRKDVVRVPVDELEKSEEEDEEAEESGGKEKLDKIEESEDVDEAELSEEETEKETVIPDRKGKKKVEETVVSSKKKKSNGDVSGDPERSKFDTSSFICTPLQTARGMFTPFNFKFWSSEAYADFQKYILGKRMHYESRVSIEEFDDFGVDDIVSHFGLKKLSECKGEINETLVKEFYANIPIDFNSKKCLFTTSLFVRGQLVKISAKDLRRWLGLNEDVSDEDESMEATNDEIAMELSGGKDTWPVKGLKQLPRSKMSKKYQILHKIVKANFDQLIHNSSFKRESARTLFLLGTKRNIDLAARIWSSIIGRVSESGPRRGNTYLLVHP